MHKMPYDKQMMDQELETKKTEEPVEEIKNEEDVAKVDDKMKDKKIESKKEEEKTEKSDKKEDKKEKKVEKKNKMTEAVVNGQSLRISTKQAVAICNFIKNKNIEDAMSELDEVSKMKRAIPMRGEIPHRKGKGMMSGRYPINAVKEFSILLKSLKANAINHELELEKVKLACMANVASRPARRFGQGKHKRTHVQIKLIPMER